MHTKWTRWPLLLAAALALSAVLSSLGAPLYFEGLLFHWRQAVGGLGWERERMGLEEEGKPEESETGDEAMAIKKKNYEFRAYPADGIPPGTRERALRQFQRLFPENQGRHER
jgi:hypothetical protein